MQRTVEKRKGMNAWVLYGPGKLCWETLPLPTPGENEALVEVRAVGICGSDIPRIYRTGAHIHPIVPGHEFAGVVAESQDTTWVGKRVGVFPLLPCQACAPCQRQRYELCRKYRYLGSRCDGGFAAYVKAPVWNLIELPERVPFDLAACLEPLAVSIHAIRRAGVTAEDRISVIGLGTIGLFALASLLSLGVKDVFALGNKAFQREMAERLGLPAGRYIQNAGELPESDVVLECVGKPETLAAALEAAGPEGRVVAVGNPDRDMSLPKDAYWRILRNQLRVLGTWNSSFTHGAKDDWHLALRLLEEKGSAFAQIITHRFPLEDLERGLRIMRDKTEPYGKIMAVSGNISA